MATVDSRGNSPREGLGAESIDDEMMFHKRGCCFWIPCIGSDRSNKLGSPSPWWERVGTSENEEKWWNKGWKAVLKVREWSEIMAGPKWKTFIRRFNKKNGGGSSNGGGSLLSGGGGKQNKFQYDPLSYSLNFDEGPGHNGQSDEDYVFRDFSSRYATIPISAKSSMDLGKDGPTFT
ncbi:Nhl domain protein [Thalictrum thalictroides]|uniref:Nhl domain protein n=1 Tax=Thalictrum thalictroides TaxID=46969 RepID=A0A7J6W8Y9_THATH|nr:Nhl domain protein [Thalictrum thalictroides]